MSQPDPSKPASPTLHHGDRRRKLPVLPILTVIVLTQLFAVFAIRRGWAESTGIGLQFWAVMFLVPVALMLLCSGARTLVRNRFRFGLKGFLAAILVLGAGLGWLGMSLEKTREQRAVLKSLGRLATIVDYRSAKEIGWRALLAPKYFDDVVELSVPTNGPMEGMTNAELRSLAKLTELDALSIHGKTIDAAGLAPLAELRHLTHLRIFECDLRGRLPNMGEFSSLESLYLALSVFEDEALIGLNEASQLEILNLNRTALGDAGVAHLSGLIGLKVLYLDQTRVTDRALEHIANLKGLEELHLRGTSISDAGLAHLAGLTKLRRLAIERTLVTAEGRQKLEQALPELVVSYDDSSDGSAATGAP